MARTDRITLIRQIEAMRGSRLICCLTSDRQNAAGEIAKDFIPVFFNQLAEFGQCKRVDVFMFTNGGDTLAAFGLSRLVREFTSSFGVLVPYSCHSAGTLLALGADEIVMTKAGTLTPIDPSVRGPLNPKGEIPGQVQLIPVSVESVAGYRSLIKNDWKLSRDGAALAFRTLADKVNPLLLGDVYRSRQQIRDLARKLLGIHRRDERNIENIVKQLTEALGSHDYLISRREARQLLGAQVRGDEPALENLIWKLYEDFKAEMNLGQLFDPGMLLNAWTLAGSRPPAVEDQKVVLVESSAFGNKFERALQVSTAQFMTPAGPTQVFQVTVVRAGWVRYN